MVFPLRSTAAAARLYCACTTCEPGEAHAHPRGLGARERLAVHGCLAHLGKRSMISTLRRQQLGSSSLSWGRTLPSARSHLHHVPQRLLLLALRAVLQLLQQSERGGARHSAWGIEVRLSHFD
jgi:hypothetical protein